MGTTGNQPSWRRCASPRWCSCAPVNCAALAGKKFDVEGKEPVWRIPAERMKMREPHIVPLSTQAAELLQWLQPITGPKGLLFPSLRSKTRPISDNTLNACLRRLGYAKNEMTAHGFRAVASTLLTEQGFADTVIELQLLIIA